MTRHLTYLALAVITALTTWSCAAPAADDVRIGAPLAPLKEFRFNDQLVWGLVLGITAVAVPTLKAFSIVGLNLLVFFGALYALRGLGVLAWFFAPGRLMVALTIGLAIFIWPLLGVFALGVGLGDTWLDWRSRPRPTT